MRVSGSARVATEYAAFQVRLALFSLAKSCSPRSCSMFSARLTSSALDAGRADVREHAQAIELAYASAARRPGVALGEVRKVVRLISSSEHTHGVALVDAHGFVVVAQDPLAIGAL